MIVGAEQDQAVEKLLGMYGDANEPGSAESGSCEHKEPQRCLLSV
jgi:hypothetical protein